MKQEREYESVCKMIKDSEIEADLNFDQARHFLNSEMSDYPIFQQIIKEEAENRYEIQTDVSEITNALLNPSLTYQLQEMFANVLTEAVNYWIEDFINCNEINNPEME